MKIYKTGAALLAILTMGTASLYAEEAAVAESAATALSKGLDLTWVLFSAALVFFMQSGFLMLETGMVRERNTINVAIKNLADFITGSIGYLVVGFSIMFGVSTSGFFGSGYFMLEGLGAGNETAFFIFQVTFMATAATITSGAIAERFSFSSYLFLTGFISLVIYPFYGHWTWGGGWLAEMGFYDFAGSTVVHSLGGWVAMAAIIVVGPRKGRFDENGKPVEILGHNMPLAVLGAFILWLGWIGFNGGSQLAMDNDTVKIILNTVMAASAGGFVVLMYFTVTGRGVRVEAIINGVLSGLVAITAGCNTVSIASSLAIGAIGAVVGYLFDWLILNRLKLDDVISAIAVHAGAGVWGTLAVALFSPDKAITFTVQLIGVAVCFGWAFLTAFIFLKVINLFSPVRVSEHAEEVGLNIHEHGAKTTWQDLTTSIKSLAEGQADLRKRLHVEQSTDAGTIAYFFNLFTEKLADIVYVVTKRSIDLYSSSQELQHAAEGLANTAAEQSAEIESISALFDKIYESFQKADRLSDEQTLEINTTQKMMSEVLQKFDQLHGRLRENASAAENLGQAMVDQNEVIDRSSDRLNKVKEISTTISTLVTILKDISRKLELLSINASIEAARSGSEGLGFAVVASEISTLSRQTAENTEKAASILADSDTVIEDNLKEFKQLQQNFGTLKTLGNTILDSSNAARAFSEEYHNIVVHSDNSMKNSAELSKKTSHELAAHRQSFETAARNLENFTTSIQQLSAQAEELHATSDLLKDASGNIKQNISQFGLAEEDTSLH